MKKLVKDFCILAVALTVTSCKLAPEEVAESSSGTAGFIYGPFDAMNKNDPLMAATMGPDVSGVDLSNIEIPNLTPPTGPGVQTGPSTIPSTTLGSDPNGVLPKNDSMFAGSEGLKITLSEQDLDAIANANNAANNGQNTPPNNNGNGITNGTLNNGNMQNRFFSVTFVNDPFSGGAFTGGLFQNGKLSGEQINCNRTDQTACSQMFPRGTSLRFTGPLKVRANVKGQESNYQFTGNVVCNGIQKKITNNVIDIYDLDRNWRCGFQFARAQN